MHKSSKLKPKTPKRPTAKNNGFEEAEPELVISHGSSLYHLDAEIGRGGFAVVFQAFNGHTGQTVAVKRFPLSAIAGKESQLSVQLAEIELMHELDHPNIVKYYDTVKSKNFLYIVLEFMENGSLVNLIKKFGCFSESLTAIYVMQVLRGLKYLHDQGVLHRDIKGANILTSKDGMVKLADFGVAMKMTDASEANPSAGGMEDTPDLAGSPYWMAPEIIEMSTPTSACDIWSVGCVVIELLTSKPPYFDLDPMSALFRIVSDDYPPFPEGISQACKDFLLQCFHKVPSMRSSADKLLAHPWLSNSSSKQSLVQTSQMLKSRSIDAADSSVGKSTEVIQSAVRMYELNLQTIPEAEHELDSDRSRSGRRTSDSLTVSGAASAKSSARGSARSETLEGAGIATAAQEATPLAAIAETDWRSVPLSGSTSLPGSISRSRSHSDEAAPAAAVLDAGFAISADSARSSQSSSVLALSHSQKTLTPPTGKRGVSREPSIDLDGNVKSSPLFIATAAEAFAKSHTDDVSCEEANSGKLSSFGELGPGASGHGSVTTASASASFLQGMKIVSDDSFDEPNWDIDMSVSRDSAEETAVNKQSLLRNALGVHRQSPSRAKGPAVPKAPFLFNLNSQSMSFTEAPPPASEAFDWGGGEDVPFERKSLVPASKSSPTASGNKLNINIPKIQIPKLALAQKPPASMHTTSQLSQHSSSIDLNKYQEDPEDDDFADFDASESSSPIRISLSPRRSTPASKPAASVRGGFVSGTGTVASSQHTSPVLQRPQKLSANSMDDDLDSDFAFEGERFDDKIKAYKIGGRVGALRDDVPLTTRSTNSNLEAASTDENGAMNSPSMGGGGQLANQLRKRMQQQVTTKDAHDEDLDAFINYQYDEKDFKQNEAKDLHFRRSREIVEIMNCIRQEIKVKEIIDLCNQLLTIFSEVPEQRDHLITHHGVMPIVDMFDARCSSSNFRMGSQGAKSTKALNVMRVVNKIIEGSVKAKEQLSLVGIIPTVMNLFDNSFRQSVYHHNTAPAPAYATGVFAASNISSSTSSDGTADMQATVPGITIGDPKPPLAPHFSLREDVDPVTLEAARFIHQICSTSSLTLQMLIGAGGLSVLTGMVSLGATLNPSQLGQNSMNVAAAASVAGTPVMSSASGHSVTTPRMNPSLSSSSQRNLSAGSASPMTDGRTLLPGIASIATFSLDPNDAAVPVTDVMLAEDNFFNPKATTNLVAENEDLLVRMQIFQMGIDCVSEVFSMKSSRSRDFCRLFVKLGLLHPLSLSFQNILAMYRARQLTASAALGMIGASSDSVTPSSSAATPREGLRGAGHQHRRESSGTAASSPRHQRDISGGSTGGASIYIHSQHQEAEESAECKYALRMASLLLTFSKSDSIVQETMVKAEHCVLQVILAVLQAPELRTSAGGRITPMSLAASSKQDTTVPGGNPAVGGYIPGMSTSPSLFKKVHLLPTYVEIVDQLLKCLKNLSMEPSALGDLETAGTLETLLPLLSGPMSDRCRSHIFPCIFNMCRINKRRQERVAALGIVPHLKKVILDGSPLRQFALPILFDLAHTSAATRAELGKWSCQPFFLDLLKENYWQAFALNSLAVWLSSDPDSVVGMLVEPVHLTKLIDFFKAAQSQTIHTLHRPLLDMMLKSPELCRAMGLSGLFTSVLIKRLRGTDEAIVLRSLLKMLQLLHEFHQSPQEWVDANNLVSLVEEFARSERKVLVRQLAKKLLLDFTESAALSGRRDV